MAIGWSVLQIEGGGLLWPMMQQFSINWLPRPWFRNPRGREREREIVLARLFR